MANVARRQQRTELVEKLYLGKLRLERRNGSPKIYARTYLQGRLIGKCTGEETPAAAAKVATEWYLDKLDRVRLKENIHGRTFAECAEAFLKHADEVREVTEGQRRNYRQKWELLKKPNEDIGWGGFDGVRLAHVDASFVMNLRHKRSKALTKQGKRVTNATLKKDLDFVRLVLRHAKEWMACGNEIPQFPSFRGREWKVVPNLRPHLCYADWKKVRALAKERAFEEGQNPRSQRQRQELYCFLMICVGAALRVEEARSLRWMDCRVGKLDDADETDCVFMEVFGHHSQVTGKREKAWAIYDGFIGFNLLKSLRTNAKPEDKLFLEAHNAGMVELLLAADLRANVEGITRDSKSLRQTGISMRLDLGPNPDYKDIARWARTSPPIVFKFYDQTHPDDSVGRITGFRPPKKKRPKSEKEQQRMEQSEKTLAKMREVAKTERAADAEWERQESESDAE